MTNIVSKDIVGQETLQKDISMLLETISRILPTPRLLIFMILVFGGGVWLISSIFPGKVAGNIEFYHLYLVALIFIFLFSRGTRWMLWLHKRETTKNLSQKETALSDY